MVGDGVVRHHQEHIEHFRLVPVVIHGWISTKHQPRLACLAVTEGRMTQTMQIGLVCVV